MTAYIPDRWVVVTLGAPESRHDRVFAGWYGGYAGAEKWQLSSGVTEVHEHDDHFLFVNESGSRYRCYKHAEGMSAYMMQIYSNRQLNNPTAVVRTPYPSSLLVSPLAGEEGVQARIEPEA